MDYLSIIYRSLENFQGRIKRRKIIGTILTEAKFSMLTIFQTKISMPSINAFIAYYFELSYNHIELERWNHEYKLLQWVE